MKRLPKIKKVRTPVKKFPGDSVLTVRQHGIGPAKGGARVNRPVTGLYPPTPPKAAKAPTPPKVPALPKPPKTPKGMSPLALLRKMRSRG